MKVLAVILGFASLLLAVNGLFSLSQATLGVGLIAFGGVIGIIARLCQAEANFTETTKQIASFEDVKRLAELMETQVDGTVEVVSEIRNMHENKSIN